MKAVHVHIAFNQHGKYMEHFQKKCVHYLGIKFYSTCTCITNLNHHVFDDYHVFDDLTKYLIRMKIFIL